MPPGTCRSCGAVLEEQVLDLGRQPPADWYPVAADLDATRVGPLQAWICTSCWLFQLGRESHADIPDGGLAAGAPSATARAHARQAAAELMAAAGLGPGALVVEVPSEHGGSLLEHFADLGAEVLGVEKAPLSDRPDLPVVRAQFSAEVAATLPRADLIVDNHALAHQPELDPFLAGYAQLLAPLGTVALEFHHARPLLAGGQFDTIRHGHFSYLSLTAVSVALARHGLAVVEATAHDVFGGALRVLARRVGAGEPGPSVAAESAAEAAAGMGRLETYRRLAGRAETLRLAVDRYLEGRPRVAGYGAPSKAAVLLNYCGVGPDRLPFTVDQSPTKQGRCIPGVGIPISSPHRLLDERPDDVLVLTWDLVDEIVAQLPEVRGWGGRFLIAVPELREISSS